MSGNTLFKYLLSKQTAKQMFQNNMSSSHENLFLSEKFEMVPNENNELLLALNQSEGKSSNQPSDENQKQDITEFIKNMADQKLNVAREITQVPSQNIEGEQWYF